MLKSVKHLAVINVNDIWETDHKHLQQAMIKYDLKNLEFDYAASDNNAKFSNYYTEKHDSLKQKWIKDGFGNFPYSKQFDFMQKAWSEHLENNINILILAYNKTDTKWWHEFVENKAEVHFIKGRLKFMIDKKFPRVCSKCKIRYLNDEPICNNMIHNSNESITMCGEKTKQNSAPYPSCWIIYRSKKYEGRCKDCNLDCCWQNNRFFCPKCKKEWRVDG